MRLCLSTNKHFLDEFLDKFKFYLQNNLSDSPNFSKIQKNIKTNNHENFNDGDGSLCTQFFLMSLDIINSKILKSPSLFEKKAPPESICENFFISKSIAKNNVLLFS